MFETYEAQVFTFNLLVNAVEIDKVTTQTYVRFKLICKFML
jgi:hypothetical protein